jgi:hypothetical protein
MFSRIYLRRLVLNATTYLGFPPSDILSGPLRLRPAAFCKSHLKRSLFVPHQDMKPMQSPRSDAPSTTAFRSGETYGARWCCSGKRKGRSSRESYPESEECARLGLASLIMRQHIEDHRCFGLTVYLQLQLVTDVEAFSGAFNGNRLITEMENGGLDRSSGRDHNFLHSG